MSFITGEPSLTFLEVGKQYTMSFSTNGIPVPQSDIQSSLTAFRFATAAVACTAPVSGYIDVTFTANVSTTVEVYYLTLIGIWNELYPLMDVSFSGISEDKKDGLACGGSSNLTTNLALIVVGILAIVFLFSGGAGLVRRAVS